MYSTIYYEASMISVIICSRDDARFAAVSSSYAASMRSEPFTILRVANTNSLARGYNAGLSKAAACDVVILSHDDIEILTPNLDRKVRELLSVYDIVGVAGTTKLIGPKWTSAGPPYIFGQIAHPKQQQFAVNIFGAPRRHIAGIQALDGVFIAARRTVFETLRFDESYDGFHLYDIDFTFRAYLAGMKLGVACEIQLIHESVGRFDDSWARYAQIFMTKHAARLQQSPAPEMMWSGVIVNSKAEVLEIMNPPFWNQT